MAQARAGPRVAWSTCLRPRKLRFKRRVRADAGPMVPGSHSQPPLSQRSTLTTCHDTLDPVRIEHRHRHRHRPLYATSCSHPSRLPLPATALIALDAPFPRFPPRSPPNAPSTRTPARPPRAWSPAVVHRVARNRQTLLTCHRLSRSSSANIALANRLPAF
jgi:hypothetical protein